MKHISKITYEDIINYKRRICRECGQIEYTRNLPKGWVIIVPSEYLCEKCNKKENNEL